MGKMCHICICATFYLSLATNAAFANLPPAATAEEVADAVTVTVTSATQLKAAYKGAKGTIAIITTGAPAVDAIMALLTADPWINIASVKLKGSIGKIAYVVAENDGLARSGKIDVGGTNITINQDAVPCKITATSVTPAKVDAGGKEVTITIAVSPEVCAWGVSQIKSSGEWLTGLTGKTVTGNGSVTGMATKNNIAKPRSTVVTVATTDGKSKKTVTVKQDKYVKPSGGKLLKTGRTVCFNPTGEQISCAGTGQDGELQMGLAWATPRFTDNGDQTINDNSTGLVWTKDANVLKDRDPGFDNDEQLGDGCVIWQHALDYVIKLNSENFLGRSDWRLPNINEIATLAYEQADFPALPAKHPFSNVQGRAYCSATTLAAIPTDFWWVNMFAGAIGSYGEKAPGTGQCCVAWPVRSGSAAATASYQVPKTGQTVCYDTGGIIIPCTGTGQDGELQKGASLPTPRFSDNSDQTISDNLTGLIWTRSGNSSGPDACGPATSKNWQGALDFVKCLNGNNYLNHSDWRLPNRNEMLSLLNRAEANSAEWLMSAGFEAVQTYYWTSSFISFSGSRKAEFVSIGSGDPHETYGEDNTAKSYFVWPVRGRE